MNVSGSYDISARLQALLQAGRVAQARNLCTDLLNQNLNVREALFFLSAIELQDGNLDEATRLLDRLLTIEPTFAPAHYHMAIAEQRRGNDDAALAHYRQALTHQPDYPQALFNAALLSRQTGDLSGALALSTTLISVAPRWANALYSHADLLLAMNRAGEALTFADKLLTLETNASAYLLRAQVLRNLGRVDESLAACDRAIPFAPNDWSLHHFRGGLLQWLNRPEDAIASYDRELGLMAMQDVPLYARENAMSEAIAARLASAHWQGLPELLTNARRLTQTTELALDPFIGVLVSDDQAELLTWATRWQQRIGTPQSPPRQPQPHTKIRIGYISADFREHAVSRLLVDLIERHDRTQFEVFGYAIGPDDASPLRQRLSKAFDHFIDLQQVDDAQAAARIANDGIDVLIDLMGHTSNHRMGIVARKPAPVIAHYLGFPASLGMTTVDYFIADAVTLPAANEIDFREAIARLPTCYQVNSHREISPRRFTRQDAGLPDTGFVYCGITRHTKLNPDVFDAWMNILRATPGSVLWLQAASPAIEQNLKSEATQRSIDAARLIFAPPLPADEYLARHAVADLFLDTWPWGGHTMTSDALWAGLPVLTAPGPNFASRVGASLLHALALPELICASHQDYVAKAIEFAQQPEQLRPLRDRLAEKRRTAALFDIDNFRREIESAYREMVARSRRGEQPTTFTASAS